ncbi:plasmid mobilization relaxosome protein MobC [Escherichia coli]
MYLYLLNNISNNINQIAKKMNTNIDSFLSGSGEQFAYLFDDLIKDIEQIKKEYDHDTQTDRR